MSSYGSMNGDHSAFARLVLDNAMHIDYVKTSLRSSRIHVDLPRSRQSATVLETFMRNH